MLHLERPVGVVELRSLSWLVGKLINRAEVLYLVTSVSTRREQLKLIAQITLQPFDGDPARFVTAVGPAVALIDTATPSTPPDIATAIADPMPELRGSL